MNRRIVTNILAVAILCVLLLPPAAQGQAISATTVRLRIGVTADGITVLRPTDLATAGIDPATVDPRTFALSTQDRPVAILVTGESDGHFDAGDAAYFFGQRFRGPEMEQKYTDERVYWLTIGGAAGPRIAYVDAAPNGDLTPPSDFPVTLRAEESTQWWTLHRLGADTEDTWFWARLQPPLGEGKVITASLPYTVPDPAPGLPAVLRLEEHSRVGYTAFPDHRTTVAFNGTPLFDQTWDGLHVRKVFSMSIAADLLRSGMNTVTVGAWNLPGVTGDDVYVNYWELDYRRQFRAWEGQLDFKSETAGTHEYVVDGWGSSNVAVWDVSNPEKPRQLQWAPAAAHRLFLPLLFSSSAATGSGGAGNASGNAVLRFRADAAAGARYWLQDRATVRSPASVRVRTDTGLRAPEGGADAVIVTSALLRPAAERLANWHWAHGRRALVVDIQDVYDEFNAGIYHPKAVPAMLAWAAQHWKPPAPTFLTLVGDGHWNFKGYNPALYPPQPNHIPPYLAWVDPWQGEVPADTLYGDLNGDMEPDIAVGRLAVNTLEEAQTVVDKIVNYDESTRVADWQRKALFVADNPDPAAGDFPAVSDEIIANNTPADLEVIRAYISRSSNPPTQAEIQAAHDTILNTIQSGVLMVQYTGHGAIPNWSHELIWHISDVAALRNSPRLPVVMTFNCLDGYFAHSIPANFSMAETMQRQAGGGSVAAISPSGLGVTTDQKEFRKILLDVMFKQNVRELGSALLKAKQEYSALYGNNYMIQTMTLFGDPALRMPGPASQ